MYNHNKAQQRKNRVHISWDILYVYVYIHQEKTIGNIQPQGEIRKKVRSYKISFMSVAVKNDKSSSTFVIIQTL